MPQKELTIAERVVVLRKIREQLPSISHRQLAEITGVPRTTRDVAAAPQTPQLGGAQANFGGPS